MMRRLHATPIDYVIVALNPALIMLLIGSLVYFLLEMFYQGQYPARLHYCLSWYVFGAVLVSRVSMEEGWERAAPLGVALAIVMILALHRFVSYEGTNLAAIGWLINYGLIALISWCAHRLTWDCTLIDETQDASGQGLLQTAGLESSTSAEVEAPARPHPQEHAASTTSVESTAIAIDRAQRPPTSNVAKQKSWWQTYLERRRRPHAHGLWVVYFSLAALPLFGIGQAVIPVANSGSRRYAFVLLCVYVAAALALLMTTSFLGLRRYLRQRRLEMPPAMCGAWLGTGAVLIVTILLFAALLPRPHAEYAISKLPSIGSPGRSASRWAVGQEGTTESNVNSAQGEQKPSRDHQQTAASESDAKQATPSENEPQDQSPEQGHRSEQTAKDDSGSKSGTREGSQTSDSQPETQPAGADGEAKQAEPAPSDPMQPTATRERNQRSTDSQVSGDRTATSDAQEDPAEAPSLQAESPPSAPSPPDPTALVAPLFDSLKWVFYAIVIALALWWTWRNRQRLASWLRGLIAAWFEFWSRLWGRSKRADLPEQVGPIHRHFSDFSDPFVSGAVNRFTAEKLVRYSFEAFEAWARDHGCPRQSDQTAYEFARYVGRRASHISSPAKNLADLFGRVVYADGKAPSDAMERLRELWEAMRRTPILT